MSGPYGITVNGFVRKTQAQILADLQSGYRALAGTGVDLSQNTFEGQTYATIAAELDTAPWQALEDTYYAAYPDTATGVQLDRIGAIAGIPRLAATPAQVVETVYGSTGADVPFGFLIGTPGGLQFANQSDFAIGAGGTGTGVFLCTTTGPGGVVPGGDITQIITPEPGISSVNNLEASYGGYDVETDAAYLARYKATKGSGASSVAAIRNACLAVPGVLTCSVNENYQPVPVNGMPPNSVHIVVTGAFNASALAQAIFGSKPDGIKPIGTLSANAQDGDGNNYVMWYDLAAQTEIQMSIAVTRNAAWISGSETVIQTAIVKYIGGVDVVNGVSTSYPGLGVGNSVKRWLVSGAIDAANVEGIDDIEILMCVKPGTPNLLIVPISGNQYPWIYDDDIAMTLQ